MGKKALVLGGGGVLGVSWETGLLAGLLDAGVDVTRADRIIGTSAGSIVSAQIALGRTLGELLDEQSGKREGAVNPPLDFDPVNLMSLFAKWAAYPVMTTERCAEIGALALASRAPSEEAWLATFEELRGQQWPDRDLRVTAVDAHSGEFRTWDRDSGVDIQRAVASSCTVPGLFPPVTINARRYVDGGVRSGTSADLAAGCETVLVVAPIGAGKDGIDPLLGRQARAEADALRAAGAHVELVFPDAAALEATGPNRMDATRRAQVADSGVRQGRELAARLEAWSTAAA